MFSQRRCSGGTQQSKCCKPSFEVNLHKETVDEYSVDSEGVIGYEAEAGEMKLMRSSVQWLIQRLTTSQSAEQMTEHAQL